jgi:type IV pilus assembly protein PilM
MIILDYHPCPMGLDISDLSIKLIQFKKRGDKIKIQAIGKTNLPKGVLVDGEIKDRETLVRFLRKIIAHPDYGKVIGNEVVACLPETRTFLKVVDIEKGVPDIEEAICGELIKHIPVPIDEMYYDFQAIRESSRTQIFLTGAAQREVVDQYTSLLHECRLSVVALESEPLSTCRALLPEEHIRYKKENKQNYAIIDIGATSANLSVYAKNSILFSVSMPISGEEITQKISEILNIDSARAEKAKMIYSMQEGEEHPVIKKILSDMVVDLVKKSRDAMNFFYHHYATWGPINKIILCGGGASIKDIEKIMQKELGVETVRGDSLINLDDRHEGFLKAFQETISVYIDFIPEEKKRSTKHRGDKTMKITHDASLSYTTAIGLGLRGAFSEEIDA